MTVSLGHRTVSQAGVRMQLFVSLWGVSKSRELISFVRLGWVESCPQEAAEYCGPELSELVFLQGGDHPVSHCGEKMNWAWLSPLLEACTGVPNTK